MNCILSIHSFAICSVCTASSIFFWTAVCGSSFFISGFGDFDLYCFWACESGNLAVHLIVNELSESKQKYKTVFLNAKSAFVNFCLNFSSLVNFRFFSSYCSSVMIILFWLKYLKSQFCAFGSGFLNDTKQWSSAPGLILLKVNVKGIYCSSSSTLQQSGICSVIVNSSVS